VAQPFGGTEHLFAGLLNLSNLPLEINVSSRAYIEVQVWVSELDPPLTPLASLRAAAQHPHRLRDLRVSPSGLNEPQFPVFSRET
jgi:hypothetical protein